MRRCERLSCRLRIKDNLDLPFLTLLHMSTPSEPDFRADNGNHNQAEGQCDHPQGEIGQNVILRAGLARISFPSILAVSGQEEGKVCKVTSLSTQLPIEGLDARIFADPISVLGLKAQTCFLGRGSLDMHHQYEEESSYLQVNALFRLKANLHVSVGLDFVAIDVR
jgi:hypothetical protein